MTDDFAVVREKLTNEPWFDEAEAALDRIEARLKAAEDKAFRMEQKLGSALDERDEARADAERLAEALREIRTKTQRKYVLRFRDRWTFADGIAKVARAALAAHEADPDADYLHGIGVEC